MNESLLRDQSALLDKNSATSEQVASPFDIRQLSDGRILLIDTFVGLMGDWVAYDSRTFDGAEDAGPLARIQGHGNTPEAARDDLIDQWEERI